MEETECTATQEREVEEPRFHGHDEDRCEVQQNGDWSTGSKPPTSVAIKVRWSDLQTTTVQFQPADTVKHLRSFVEGTFCGLTSSKRCILLRSVPHLILSKDMDDLSLVQADLVNNTVIVMPEEHQGLQLQATARGELPHPEAQGGQPPTEQIASMNQLKSQVGAATSTSSSSKWSKPRVKTLSDLNLSPGHNQGSECVPQPEQPTSDFISQQFCSLWRQQHAVPAADPPMKSNQSAGKADHKHTKKHQTKNIFRKKIFRSRSSNLKK